MQTRERVRHLIHWWERTEEKRVAGSWKTERFHAIQQPVTPYIRTQTHIDTQTCGDSSNGAIIHGAKREQPLVHQASSRKYRRRLCVG